MNTVRKMVAVIVPVAGLLVSGCAASRAGSMAFDRPERAPELDAYNVFVGSWTWEAEMADADGPDKSWNGTAEWSWTLDNRALNGSMSASSESTKFEAEGVWSWHPKSKKYIWWMFNNWGYPQEGTARYDADTKCWRMDYRSVGLDGTRSYGRYKMKVIDDNTLDWCVVEWADRLHLVQKMEMSGTYKRK